MDAATRQLLINLVAFADNEHDTIDYCGYDYTPGDDCKPSCEACKLLTGVTGVTDEILTAARQPGTSRRLSD